jgi:hypothetical protein
LQYRKSVACIIATNVSPPDAQPLFANGLMRAGLARVVSCFPYRWFLRSRSGPTIQNSDNARFTSRAIRAQRSLLRKLRSRRNFWQEQPARVVSKPALVAGNDDRAALVAARDELEEEIGSLPVDWTEVGSERGAVAGLPLLRFPLPPAKTGRARGRASGFPQASRLS